MTATQLLFKNRRPGETVFLSGYRATGGYHALARALREMSPDEIRQLVKASGLRGRGGAGFPTGIKWTFFPADKPNPKYLVCNCDEMEPGTYKDGELLRADPHQLVEGMIISAFALQTNVGYIFIRYAYEQQAQNLRRAIAEAKAAGYLGDNILGSGFDFELHVHGSAGRYILGEETALLNGLEGRRPTPRLKPPFPAVKGLFGRPTTVNNVETLANIPHIVTGGAHWFKDLALTVDGSGLKCGENLREGHRRRVGAVFLEHLHPPRAVRRAELDPFEIAGLIDRPDVVGDVPEAVLGQSHNVIALRVHRVLERAHHLVLNAAHVVAVLDDVRHFENTEQIIDRRHHR